MCQEKSSTTGELKKEKSMINDDNFNFVVRERKTGGEEENHK